MKDKKLGFPGGSVGKEIICNSGDLGWEFLGEGHGNPLQYSCLENLLWDTDIPKLTFGKHAS